MKFSKKAEADKVVNQVLEAYWGNSSNDLDDSEQGGYISMMVMEDEVSSFDSLFALMANTENDEDKLVTLLDIKKKLKDYSLSKLRSLASVLIYSLNELDKDKKNLKSPWKNMRKK